MVALITLDEAKRHLRVDHTDDDADIQEKIEEASDIVLDYCKKTIGTLDPDDPSIVDWDANLPGTVRAALKFLLSELYDDRIAGTENDERHALGYLTPRITALLHRHRDPALA